MNIIILHIFRRKRTESTQSKQNPGNPGKAAKLCNSNIATKGERHLKTGLLILVTMTTNTRYNQLHALPDDLQYCIWQQYYTNHIVSDIVDQWVWLNEITWNERSDTNFMHLLCNRNGGCKRTKRLHDERRKTFKD